VALRPLHSTLFRYSLIFRVYISYPVVPLVHLSSVHHLDLRLLLLVRRHPFFHWSNVCLIPFSPHVALLFSGYTLKDGRCKILRNSIACALIYVMSYPEDWLESSFHSLAFSNYYDD
jgi:hypothetical protein